MNLLFDSRAGILELFVRMHKSIAYARNDYNPVTVVHNIFEEKRSVELGVNPSAVISTFLKENWNMFDISRKNIARIEETYLQTSFNYIIAIDRILSNGKDSESNKKYFVGYFEFFRKIMEDNMIDIYVSEVVVGLWNYIPYLLCNKFKIKYMGISSIRVDDRFNFITDEYHTIFKLKELYQSSECLSWNKDSTNGIKKLSSDNKQPAYTTNYIKKEILKNKTIISSVHNVIHKTLKSSNAFDKWDYKTSKILTSYKAEFVFRIKKRILSYFTKFIWSKPEASEQYFLYTLHFEPEASTLVDGHFFSNQIELITNISKALPHRYTLYVKEHVASFGRRRIGFYKQIKNIPNVKLVSPFHGIFDLIKNCKIVFTITGTVALEAIQNNKPTIIFGNTFFNFYKYIYKVTDFTNLASVIYHILNNYNDIINDHESKKRFFYSLWRRSYPAYLNTSDMSKVIKDENLKLIVNGFLNEIEYQKTI